MNKPEWLDKWAIDEDDIIAIQQGGCASGAFMPAVTYHTAVEHMSEYGDEILQYIEDSYGEIPAPIKGESWSGIAVYYFSMAVELWASGTEI